MCKTLSIAFVNKMSGTTDGLVYTLTVSDEPMYVLKFDNPHDISISKKLLESYSDSKLIPEVIYTDSCNRFIVYTYIKGTTHYNRGSKLNWLTLLVTELLNRYVIYHQTDIWGRFELPRESWREFNERSLEGARLNVENLLPIEDYDEVTRERACYCPLLRPVSCSSLFIFTLATIMKVQEEAPNL